ncbi:hypothetical protein COS31_00225 [Candidatus Roizmanbacteria bacterium CG02_land_8_20_14_3_00_36_15]|uniref:Sodium/calcium exchanger membrane region domain-containing protein n=2 Tax=Candidatus Roizmaniibacteriota TaxID=1752723 RepID=A0A2M8KK04_9BACT|nr:MAG: hypothetical protein COS51_04775 [Candidatus Roizmanbacteria bacterium CG03_land_8_20_14_0_80_36_21]PIV38290.1 MAG: hypothetical protein COS31_00225 [Candidatus Roizmanbacteria bacterium CG02_land_8_20_14_3_00_36_15]PJA53444.1 MAG: hypothetical protein CO166_01840 [Candidatus Roizmanbacteria bacterium CG_4_9_14_3_um_filter_36_11]PJC81445.1 MAG: hypothetical protein CO007_04605 [Candidatus Roizmanbacteria bacterium CG_4_8_14_3_um_filter_36_10]PJE60247.1 MAG: hypothetical protein COU86_05
MEILLAIFLVFFFCFILYKTSEVLINSLKSVADDSILSKFLLASIFGGVATSLPELFIGISSAIDKKPEIAIGNALGSNIVDLALVVPLVILISGRGFYLSIKRIFLFVIFF